MRFLKKFIKNASSWEKLLILCIVILLINYMLPKREGFKSQKKQYVLKTDDLFDEFYCSIYDELLLSTKKNIYEVKELMHVLNPKNGLRALDVGSGTGPHVEILNEKGYECMGIDKSSAMIEKSKENYPDNNYQVVDALNTSAFDASQYDLITCFYFTIYYLQDKETFFHNCIQWLAPGGYFVIHLVDRNKFDPMVPPANPLVIVSPQKYAKERITESTVHFGDFKYSADFKMKDDDLAIFKEKMKFKNQNKVRENEHRLYMEKHQDIIKMIKKVGFLLDGRIHLNRTQYEHQYLYVFKKPNI